MKNLCHILAIVSILIGGTEIASAQYWDDLYIRPSTRDEIRQQREKQAEQERAEAEKKRAEAEQTYVPDSLWNVDAYNRRYEVPEETAYDPEATVETAGEDTTPYADDEGYYLNGFYGTQSDLEYAERTTKDKIEEIPEFFLVSWAKKLRSTMSCTAWTVISLVLLAATLALGLVYLLSQRISMRKSGFYGMAVALVLFIATTLMAWSERNMLVERNEAVVMSSALSVKSSPDKSATDLFVLHEGTVVTIGSTVEGWAEVRIADGNKGWVETDRIERI